MTLSESALREIEKRLAAYPDPMSAALYALTVAESEVGWLSPEALRTVASVVGISPAMLRGTASFYSLFRNKKMGRHLIQLCTNVSCLILGGERLEDFLEKRYGLVRGGTTEDGRFSLLIMECIGACDRGPAMQIGTTLYGPLTEERLEEILESYS